jgi:hypothetical protein
VGETFLGGRALRVTRIGGAIGPAASPSPGTVVASSPEGIDVEATGGVIRITGIEDGSRPHDALAGAGVPIAVGDRLA